MQGNKLFRNTAHLPKITGTAPMGCVIKIPQFLLDARHVGIEIQQLDKHVGLVRWCRKPLIEYIERKHHHMYIYASPKTWITVAVLHALLGSEDPLDLFCCNSTTWINPVTRLQPTDMCPWHRNQAEEEFFVCLFVWLVVCLIVCLSVCLFVCLVFRLFVCLFVCFKIMGLELKIMHRYMRYGYIHRYPFINIFVPWISIWVSMVHSKSTPNSRHHIHYNANIWHLVSQLMLTFTIRREATLPLRLLANFQALACCVAKPTRFLLSMGTEAPRIDCSSNVDYLHFPQKFPAASYSTIIIF